MPEVPRPPSLNSFGPYAHGRKWRIVNVAPGEREYLSFDTEDAALQAQAEFLGEIKNIAHTTDSARREFIEDMRARELAETTVNTYDWAINVWWPDAVSLHAITPARCERRYKELYHATGKKKLAVDSHRNVLKQCKTFLRWCVRQHWIKKNPMADVAGVGKRKHGKTQLRIDEARKWNAKALELAAAGDVGAVGALCTIYLTLRAGEVVGLEIRDIDDDGKLLWVADSKTPAGRRTEWIPEVLQPHLQRVVQHLVDEHKTKHPDEDVPGETKLFPWSRSWPRGQVLRICDLAKVPDTTAHAMRGLHATIARDAGATSELVANALGHEDDRVTKTAYMDREADRQATKRAGFKVLAGGKE